MANKLRGVVSYIVGTVFGKDGAQILSQQEAWRQEARCGCGIDCCYGALVLKDQCTGESVYVYIEDGEVKTTTNPKEDLAKVGDGKLKEKEK